MISEGLNHKPYCVGCIHIIETKSNGSIRCKVNPKEDRYNLSDNWWTVGQQIGCKQRCSKLLDDQE